MVAECMVTGAVIAMEEERYASRRPRWRRSGPTVSWIWKTPSLAYAAVSLTEVAPVESLLSGLVTPGESDGKRALESSQSAPRDAVQFDDFFASSGLRGALCVQTNECT